MENNLAPFKGGMLEYSVNIWGVTRVMQVMLKRKCTRYLPTGGVVFRNQIARQ